MRHKKNKVTTLNGVSDRNYKSVSEELNLAGGLRKIVHTDIAHCLGNAIARECITNNVDTAELIRVEEGVGGDSERERESEKRDHERDVETWGRAKNCRL